jgi:hypothetical protein
MAAAVGAAVAVWLRSDWSTMTLLLATREFMTGTEIGCTAEADVWRREG